MLVTKRLKPCALMLRTPAPPSARSASCCFALQDMHGDGADMRTCMEKAHALNEQRTLVTRNRPSQQVCHRAGATVHLSGPSSSTALPHGVPACNSGCRASVSVFDDPEALHTLEFTPPKPDKGSKGVLMQPRTYLGPQMATTDARML